MELLKLEFWRKSSLFSCYLSFSDQNQPYMHQNSFISCINRYFIEKFQISIKKYSIYPFINCSSSNNHILQTLKASYASNFRYSRALSSCPCSQQVIAPSLLNFMVKRSYFCQSVKTSKIHTSSLSSSS